MLTLMLMSDGSWWGVGGEVSISRLHHLQAPLHPTRTSALSLRLSTAAQDPILSKSCLTCPPHRKGTRVGSPSPKHVTHSSRAAHSQHLPSMQRPLIPPDVVINSRACPQNPAWQLKQVQVPVLHPAPRCSKPQCMLCPTQRTVHTLSDYKMPQLGRG
jgi:hypothetical protein